MPIDEGVRAALEQLDAATSALYDPHLLPGEGRLADVEQSVRNVRAVVAKARADAVPYLRQTARDRLVMRTTTQAAFTLQRLGAHTGGGVKSAMLIHEPDVRLVPSGKMEKHRRNICGKPVPSACKAPSHSILISEMPGLREKLLPYGLGVADVNVDISGKVRYVQQQSHNKYQTKFNKRIKGRRPGGPDTNWNIYIGLFVHVEDATVAMAILTSFLQASTAHGTVEEVIATRLSQYHRATLTGYIKEKTMHAMASANNGKMQLAAALNDLLVLVNTCSGSTLPGLRPLHPLC